MTQPEALRLADALRDSVETDGEWSQEQVAAAAAELRRLHAERTAADGVINDLVAKVRGLQTQRDALLEALKAAEPYLRHADVAYNVYVQARATIKAGEGENP